MTDIAVSISDYRGRRTAQLLENQVPVQTLLPPPGQGAGARAGIELSIGPCHRRCEAHR
jgi:hypothetical protein